jgi:hypothetical protein
MAISAIIADDFLISLSPTLNRRPEAIRRSKVKRLNRRTMSTGKGYPEIQYAVKLEANRLLGWEAARFGQDGGRNTGGWSVRLFCGG